MEAAFLLTCVCVCYFFGVVVGVGVNGVWCDEGPLGLVFSFWFGVVGCSGMAWDGSDGRHYIIVLADLV